MKNLAKITAKIRTFLNNCKNKRFRLVVPIIEYLKVVGSAKAKDIQDIMGITRWVMNSVIESLAARDIIEMKKQLLFDKKNKAFHEFLVVSLNRNWKKNFKIAYGEEYDTVCKKLGWK